MIRTSGALALCLAGTLAAATGHAAEPNAVKNAAGTASAGEIVVRDAWTRQAPPGARVAAGYAVILNRGARTDALEGARAGFAGRTEIHEMTVADGVMRMAPVGSVELAPGASIELKPGGLHLMFLDLIDPPQAGERVGLTLLFRDAGEVTMQIPVAPIGATVVPQDDRHAGR